jgi:hypothetical protein
MAQAEQSGDIDLSGQDRVHIELADFINVVELEGLTGYIFRLFLQQK